MIFQCGDLDRALQHAELMPDARAHAEQCDRCREQLYLWAEISNLAPRLHREWESPGLWSRIQIRLAAEAPGRAAPAWRWAMAAAAAALIAVVLLRWPHTSSPELLTEEAFEQVQRAEAAYARSIGNLSKVAGPALDRSPSSLAAAYREKLLLLDAEIAELKAAADRNRYNTHIENELASLYREKQKTLEEWLNHANRNSTSTH